MLTYELCKTSFMMTNKIQKEPAYLASAHELKQLLDLSHFEQLAYILEEKKTSDEFCVKKPGERAEHSPAGQNFMYFS